MSAVDWSAISAEDTPNFTADTIPLEDLAEPDKGSKSKRGPKPKTVKPKSPTPTARQGKYVDSLKEIYGYAGMAITVVDPICGAAILESAEQCATSVDELAYKNPAVRRVIESITQTSVIGAVVAAHMPILLAVAMHHGGKLFALSGTTDESVSAT